MLPPLRSMSSLLARCRFAAPARVLADYPRTATSSLVDTGIAQRLFSSTSDENVLTGNVKFYLRDKAYGFIIPDSGHPEEVWVHRTSFDTPHSPEEFPTRPYLVKDERVQFQIEESSGGSSPKAVKVKFANGRPIPLYRKNYHASVVRGEMLRFGQSVYEILQDSTLSDEDKWKGIQAAVHSAEDLIQQAAQRQELYGPEGNDV